MSNWRMKVKARNFTYSVTVDDNAFERFAHTQPPTKHVIIDQKVADLYGAELRLATSPLLVKADESAKSIDRLGWYAKLLLDAGIRRDHEIVAIGGGVVQDIACFLSGTLLRGVPWTFYPTTLLAQADSCIGGKSCINVGSYKNAMGTFTPPRAVWVVPHVLDTLPDIALRSGIGEILKVNAIAGPAWFDEIATAYPQLLTDRDLLLFHVRRALGVKKRYVENDEFDRGHRRLLNYGHSFGHAIESATDFAIPHGIAVTVGMDMANYVAMRLAGATGGCGARETYQRMRPTLAANYACCLDAPIRFGPLLDALRSDKKNINDQVSLILPDQRGVVVEQKLPLHAVEDALCGYDRLRLPEGVVCA